MLRYKLGQLSETGRYDPAKKRSRVRSTTTKNQIGAWLDWLIIYKANEEATKKKLATSQYPAYVLDFYNQVRAPWDQGESNKWSLAEEVREHFFGEGQPLALPEDQAKKSGKRERPHALLERQGHGGRAIKAYIDECARKADKIIANVARGEFPGEHR